MKMECGLVGQLITTLYGRIQRTIRGPTHLVGLRCVDGVITIITITILTTITILITILIILITILSAWEVCGDSIVDLLAPEWDTVHRPHHGKGGATHKRGPESTQVRGW